MNVSRFVMVAFQEGGWAMWPILALFIGCIVLAVERVWSLIWAKLDGHGFCRIIGALGAARDVPRALQLCEAIDKPLSRIVGAGLAVSRHGDEKAMDAAMSAAARQELSAIERGLGHLPLLGNVATWAGLLGTIVTLRRAFVSLSTLETLEPELRGHVLSKAISEAMNCTAFGLLVGIFAVGAFAVISAVQRRVIDDIHFFNLRAVRLWRLSSSRTARARTGINWSIMAGEAPVWQGARRADTCRYPTDEQHSQKGWIDGQNDQVIPARALKPNQRCPIQPPRSRLLDQGGAKQGRSAAGKKPVVASLQLTPLIDMMVVLVFFMLFTFSSAGQIICVCGREISLPFAQHVSSVERAPIISISAEDSASAVITLDGSDMATVQEVLDDNPDWKIAKLTDQLEVSHYNWKLTHPQEDFPGEVLIEADRRVDFKVIKKVLYSAGLAGFHTFVLVTEMTRRYKDS
jgi:biopolymer transport protein ExbB